MGLNINRTSVELYVFKRKPFEPMKTSQVIIFSLKTLTIQLCKVPFQELQFALLSAFYVFNIQ